MKHPCFSLWKLIKDNSYVGNYISTILTHGWLTNGVIAVKLTQEEISFFKKEFKKTYKDCRAFNVPSILPQEVRYCMSVVAEHPEVGDQPALVELQGGGKTVCIQKKFYDILRKRYPKGEFYTTNNEGSIAYSEKSTVAVVAKHPMDKTT